MIGLDPVVRPLAPGDADRLVRMFSRLSNETVYRRFFTSMTKLDSRMLGALTAVDHDRHEALVVAVGGEIVALASYHRGVDDPATADVAVLIEDGWQHHGLGRVLMRRLTRLARSRGVVQFHADVLADNAPAVGLVRRLARGSARARLESGELVYDLPLVAPAA